MADVEFYIGTFGPYIADDTEDAVILADDAQVVRRVDLSYGSTVVGGLNILDVGSVAGIGYNTTTGERGFLTKGINRTGHTSVKGELVACSTSADKEYILQTNEYDTVGVIAESGIAEGSAMWIWKVGSICQVLFKDTVASTRGNILLAADTNGRAIDVANPGSGLPATDIHFKECGHVLESKGAGTDVLVLAEIHFN